MSPLVVAVIALGGLALMERKQPPPTVTTRRRQPDRAVMQIIADAAKRHGVPPGIALAFASMESGFDPRALGDRQWHSKRGGALYKEHVLNNPRLAQNPARLDPTVWASYGLFQLLAAHHVAPLEHPHALYNPKRNAEGGVRFIASLLQKAGGDVRRARLAYVGCGLDGTRCDPEYRDKVIAKLEEALRQWGAVG